MSNYTTCEECGKPEKRETYYPEPNIRYESFCENCGHGVVEYDD